MMGITPANGCANTVVTTGNSYANPAMNGTEPLLSMFSTYAKADACTTAQVSKVVGVADATIASQAMAAGITLFTGTDHTKLTTDPSKKTVTVGASQYTYLVDLCVLETQAEAADANGVQHDVGVAAGARTWCEIIAAPICTGRRASGMGGPRWQVLLCARFCPVYLL